MRCGTCGFENPESMRFCGGCGAKLPITCGQCAFVNPPQFRFCGGCGAPLGAPETPAAPPPQPPPPAAEPVRPSLEAERRQVTVLFSDVSGSTAITERLDPEEFRDIMNDCFQRLGARITKYEGTIDKYIGDNIMALFGAPIAHENDAERAIRAALEMQEELKQISVGLEKRIGRPLAMRIGINTGEVIAGGIGSEAKIDYTVMGDAVNVASRLEHSAGVGKVLVSHSTYSLTQGVFDFTPLEPLYVKGKEKPLQVYEVIGLAKQRRPMRGIEGLESKFIGRTTELEQLKSSFTLAMMGKAQLVCIVGEAGLGKSRLLFEFRKYLEESGRLETVTYLKGRCLPYTQGNTYSAVSDLLRDYFHLTDEDTEEDIQTKMAARLEASELRVPINHLLSGAKDVSPSHLSPQQWKKETFAAVRQLLEREAGKAPLLIVVEDLHWVDPSSFELLDFLTEQLKDVPIFFCLLHRPDLQEPEHWWTHPGHTRIALQPLTVEQGSELIVSLLSVTSLPDETRELIVQRSGGNPFYVEEIIRSLIESKLLVRENHTWRADGPITPTIIPESVQGVIMSRLDRLEEKPKRVLQQAAVIGRRFSLGLLREISDVAELNPCLSQLEEGEFIFLRDRHAREPEYTFKHILTQEVAYNSLLLRSRRELHQKVAERLERRYSDRLEPHVEALAHHYHRGEVWAKALRFSALAGDKAKRLYANREALHYYSQALEAVDHLEKQPDQAVVGLSPEEMAVSPEMLRGQRVEILTNRGDVYALLGEYDDALTSYEGALAHCWEPLKYADILWRIGENVHEKRGKYDLSLGVFGAAVSAVGEEPSHIALLARIRASIAKVYLRQGRYELARQFSLDSIELLRGSEHHRELAQAWRQLGYVHYLSGNWDEAIGCWEKGISEAKRTGDPWEVGALYNNLGAAYIRKGDYGRGTACFEDYLRVADKLGYTSAIADAYTNLGGSHRMRGDLPRAIEHYQKSLSMKEKIGDARGVVRNLLNLGEAYRELGRAPESIESLKRSLQMAQGIGAGEALTEICRQLGESYIELGDQTTAFDYALRALHQAQQTGNRLEEAIAHRVLSTTYRLRGDWASAAEHLSSCEQLLQELGSERETALALYERALFCIGQGEPAKAQEYLSQAIASLQKLGTTKDLEKARNLHSSLSAGQQLA
ncbi:MAG: tetratricopeptide repeat protein [Chloroflexi bacterium]|nr:tetratricopeptide repeat protein [Chloroflexota bacterium]MCL5075166.1 tetratricopeptide repeat protein [Chloroflexota bacterium]